MSKKDYYQVLSLNNDCTSKEVKKNFHKLALIWHPDKHSDKDQAEGKFKEIHEAYCVLSDENKRKLYDQYGHTGLNGLQQSKNCNPFTNQDVFSRKDKSSKSPFEVFRNIFKDNDEEEEDDTFYQSFFDCNPFHMSDKLHKNIKSFFEDAFMSSENEESETFFNGYKPSFMDSDFFSTPSLFQTFECQNEFSSASDLFSSFFPSMGTETQSFSRTSTTINNKGNVKTSVKQRIQKGDQVYETQHCHTYNSKTQQKNCLDSKKASKPLSNKNKDFILIEDSDRDEEEVLATKKNKPNPENAKSGQSKKRNDNPQKSFAFNKNSCLFDMNPLDEDFKLLFSGMNGLGAFPKCKK